MVKRNLTGLKFGRLTVIEKLARRDKSNSIVWKCRCECGNYTTLPTKRLISGDTKSCGCLQRSQTRLMNTIDKVGSQFGHLKAIQPVESKGIKHPLWLCECDCGRRVVKRADALLKATMRTKCCKYHETKPNNTRIELAGDRFGKLLVLKEVGRGEKQRIVWSCVCDCGTRINAVASDLKAGRHKSCGSCAAKGKQISIVNGTNLSLLTLKPPKNNKTGIKGVSFDKKEINM